MRCFELGLRGYFALCLPGEAESSFAEELLVALLEEGDLQVTGVEVLEVFSGSAELCS